MSKLGKGLFVLALLTIIAGVVIRILEIESGPYWAMPFVVALLFIVIEVVVDRKVYKEFMTMKTTKHGVNMGTMIVLMLVLLTAINYVAVKRNKKWDLTTEKLNSLSDQTIKLLNGLTDPLEIRAFFREDSPEEGQQLEMVKHFIGLMKTESSKIDFQVIDPMKRPDLSKEYEVVASGSVVLKYKGHLRTIQEATGITEEAIANTLLKITREKNKHVYYLVGHGELNFDNDKDPQGGSFIKKALQDASYDAFELNLITQKAVPEGADVVMVLGPKQALLPIELSALEDYARKGGHLFITIDPGQKTNLGAFLQKLGVIFTDKYIIDQLGQQIAGSAALAVGMEYSPTSEITKDIKEKRITLFNLAGPLEKDPKAPQDWRFEEFVKSSPASFVTNSLSSQMKFDEKRDKKIAATVGMTVVGKLGSKNAQGKQVDTSGAKEFSLVVFGDTDMLSNQLFYEQINRDIAMNSIAFLAKDTELISLRPKTPVGTRLEMTNTQAQLLVLGVYFPIPILLLIFSSIVWFRRRGA